MDNFNLLPPEYKSRWKIRWVPIIIVASVVMCSVSIALMEWNLGRMHRNQTVIEISQQKNQDLAEFRYLSLRAKTLNKEYEVLGVLITDHVIWSNLLIEFSRSIPEGVWLNSLSMSATQNMCNIQGTAINSNLVLGFEQCLKDLPFFKEAAISTITRNPLGEGTGVVYEISCKFNKDLQ